MRQAAVQVMMRYTKRLLSIREYKKAAVEERKENLLVKMGRGKSVVEKGRHETEDNLISHLVGCRWGSGRGLRTPGATIPCE